MIKKILALVPGLSSIFYSVAWAVMITGEAAETSPIVLPLRLMSCTSFYIVYRTNLSANATFDAFVAVDMERFVGDEVSCEVASDESGVYAGPPANVRQRPNFAPVEYILCVYA